MTSAFVMLGKLGDVLSIAPILNQRWKETGERQKLVISKKYSSITERMPYIDPVIFDGDWKDLDGALRFAKRNFDQVYCPSTFGHEFPIHKQKHSFQLDQWIKARSIDRWAKLPLDMVRPTNASEIVDRWLPKDRPVILFGDTSQSSPFGSVEELKALLVQHFSGTHEIVPLSGIVLDNPADLLALYDKADCLVSVETMHLHLAKASNVPTVAIATDHPSLWHGSAWHPSFSIHCRYNDFARRKPEIIDCIRGILENRPKIGHVTVENLFSGGYNPSVVRTGDKILMAYRWHDQKRKSNLGLCELSPSLKARRNWPVKMPDAVSKYSIEDPRIFHHQGRLFISYTMSQMPHSMQCAVGYGELREIDGQWEVIHHVQPKLPKNDMKSMVKNVVFFERGQSLFCIYGSGIVYGVNGEKIVGEHKSPSPEWKYGGIRGGTTPIPYKGKLLRFFHSRDDGGKKPWYWRYYIGACLHEATPPFAITAIRELPLVSGDEEWYQNQPLWKPNCSLPFGAIEHDGGWLVSYGHQDCACRLMKITPEQLNL